MKHEKTAKTGKLMRLSIGVFSAKPVYYCHTVSMTLDRAGHATKFEVRDKPVIKHIECY